MLEIDSKSTQKRHKQNEVFRAVLTALGNKASLACLMASRAGASHRIKLTSPCKILEMGIRYMENT